MLFDGYLFEKACYVLDGLARVAEDAKALSIGSAAQTDVVAHLNVALRHGLNCLCLIAREPLDPEWVAGVAREGPSYWTTVVKPRLEEAGRRLSEEAFGGPGRAEEEREAWSEPDDDESWRGGDEDEDWEDDDSDEERPAWQPARSREEYKSQLADAAARSLSALVDLTEAVRKHGCQELAEAGFEPHLAGAFNGATKVMSETHRGVEWSYEWPEQLATRGREALSALICSLQDAGAISEERAALFQPLDEAWLSTVDPERTPEAEQEAERRRRLEITRKTRLHSDLLIPDRFRKATPKQFLVDSDPGHDICARYAEQPEGALVLHGEFKSALHGIQWAIGRYWFIDQLQAVGAVEWRSVVEDNLMAQDPTLWTCPRLLICSLCPVALWSGTGYADPGYAERMLEHRLIAKLPTVITIERFGWEHLNLRSRTVELLKASTNVVLSRLSDEERKASGLEF